MSRDLYPKKRVEIIRVCCGQEIEASENLTQMVNQGWEIVAGGGYSGGVNTGMIGDFKGFVVLQKEFSDEELRLEKELDLATPDGPDTFDELDRRR